MKRIHLLLAMLAAVAVLAAACSSSSESDLSQPTAEAVEPTESSPQPTGEPSAENQSTTDETPDPTEDIVSSEPQYGGSLTYLLEAETDTWDIPNTNCAVSCITVMNTISDPMTIVNKDGEIEPFLLESYESNADFTEFTLVMREGVTFHDGTPVDGAAIQRNLVEAASGRLQAQMLQDLENGIDGIELVDDLTVKVTFTEPTAVFPFYISQRVGGWVLAPSFWDDPDRGSLLPISTGPFQMVEWNRDESTVLQRNEDYWRSDAAGNELPYLDEVVFRPNSDGFARKATMESGDGDITHDSNPENAEFWEGDWLDSGGQLASIAPPRETTFLLLNSGAPPFDNPDMRRALALCTDREEYITFRAPGTQLADGPFAEGDLGHAEDSGFPQFDPEAGSALWDEVGRPDVVNYGYQESPANKLSGELLAQQWSTNCGLNVELSGFDQSELITRAVTGAFEIIQFRNHGQGNPALEKQWWHSRHAEGLALNFGRIRDPELDALLDQTTATDDRVELDALGQEISRLFGERVYNVWLHTTQWAHPHAAEVHNVGHMTLSSGAPVQDAVAGRVWLHEVWKDGDV